MRAASQSRSPTRTKAFPEPNGNPSHEETEKFPDFDPGHASVNGPSTNQRRQQSSFAYGNGSATHSLDRWHARRDSRVRWDPLSSGHGKKNSISNAIHRMRSGSMSQNAHQIAGALRAPVSWKLIVCLPWLQHGDP